MSPSIMFIAGDPSGDQHAAAVVRAVRAGLPDASVWGIGGPAMEREGFTPEMPFAPFNRMGFLEVAAHIGFFLSAKRKLVAAMAGRRPDVLVCVDYSGFNIPMMREAHGLGIPVVWYIAPMVWAWKRDRAAVLGEHASHIAVIFPFEVPYFSPFRSPVTFVGNPIVEAMEREGSFASPRKTHPGPDGFRLAIVPGSRRQEIEELLPRMIGAFSILKQKFPSLRAAVSRYSALPSGIYKKAIGGAPVDVFDGPLRELLAHSDCALVTSGTATLETALLGVPEIIAYRTSYVSYAIAKRLVRLPYIGLPNIIAGKLVVPECIQRNAEAANLALAVGRFIESPDLYDSTVGTLTALRERLGEKKPSEELSAILKGILEQTARP